jgi:hypothetical protein
MSLFDEIIKAYPELADNQKMFVNGTITLQDDADDLGAYIAEWNYSKPLPKGLKVGK